MCCARVSCLTRALALGFLLFTAAPCMRCLVDGPFAKVIIILCGVGPLH